MKTHDEDIINNMRSYINYDPDTGLFLYFRSRGKMKAGQMAGTKNKWGHIEINFKQKKYQAHRLAWRFHYSECPNGIIDHINREESDNRICNLRLSTCLENMHNRDKPHPINKTGLIGANFKKKTGKWSSQIRFNYKIINLGSYDTAEQAHQAYMKEKSKLHKAYALSKEPRHE